MATETDKTNIGVIATVVTVGACAMIAVSAALTGMVRTEVRELSAERGAFADLRTVSDLKAGQRDELSKGPRWADKAKGLVAIPIDQAMDLVVDDVKKHPGRISPQLQKKAEADAGAGDAGAGKRGKGRKGKKNDKDKQGENTPLGAGGGSAAPEQGSPARVQPSQPAPTKVTPPAAPPAPPVQGTQPTPVTPAVTQP